MKGIRDDKAVVFFVAGIPQPQGSKKSIGNNRFIEANVKLPSWRADVRARAEKALLGQHDLDVATDEPLFGKHVPVRITVNFFIKRPASVTEKQRPFPSVKPDVDKLLRAIFDALTHAKVWVDDGQVVSVVSEKIYLTGEDGQSFTPGAWIEVVERKPFALEFDQ